MVGDWNGSGTKKIGVFRGGLWVLDYNGNFQWDGPPADRYYGFGTTGDTPVVGRWVAPAAPPSLGPVTPTGNTGSQQTFSFLASDADGGSYINSLQLLFDNAGGHVNACYFWIDQGSQWIWLRDDANTTWGQAVIAGQSGTLSNGQCSLNAAGSSITVSGVNLTVNLAVTFYPAFAGPHNITMEAVDWTGLDVGPAPMGTWTVPSAPVTVPAAMATMTDTATGQTPAATNPAELCAPNVGTYCNWYYSSIATTYPPTQIPLAMYGTSGTYTTGNSDVRSQFTNYTSNLIEDQYGRDLGHWCADAQGHPIDTTSRAESPAEARVPCADLNFSVSASNVLYTLFGKHRAYAQFYDQQGHLVTYDSGIVTDYYSLGMVPAGRSSDFGPLPMGPFADFTKAVGPTITPNYDGVTVRYTGQTVGTVSVHIDVPYGALKGRHQLGFPANNNYGQADPFELSVQRV